MSSNNRISNLVNSQVPFFVRSDHRTFVAFMEAYYEYLQQNNATLNQGRVVERAENLLNYIDVDTTLADFSQKFYQNFLSLLPNTIEADKEVIIKNVKDFYRAKGSEKSLKFLLRLLTDGNEADIYYPKLDILRASDGKWFIQKSLRVEDVRVAGVANTDLVALQNFVSHIATGNTSNASAVIEKVDRFYENGTLINELIISSDEGTFLNGETVFTTFIEEGATKSLSANVFGGILNSISITQPGSGYSVGNTVIIESDSGSGAMASVTQVSSGNLSSILVTAPGAGFKAGEWMLFTGGDGSGANGNVLTVDTSETYHPNTYNIYSSIIQLEANTLLGNAVYSNLNTLLIQPNANTTLINSLNSFAYGPIGPITSVSLRNRGQNYTSVPTVDVIANTTIKSLGILGRMEVIDGGLSYSVGDRLEFTSGIGYGANGEVKSVHGNGAINLVQFTANSGWVIGGFGYSQSALPTINVATSTGSGANVVVKAILGDGETIGLTTSVLGAIERITITNRGQDYTEAPTLNLTQSGDGTAQAIATIVTGVYTYDGRYLNDDGHLSSFNFLQDRDYYQNFSYVVRIKNSLEEYKQYIENIVHPGGMKLFGEYMTEDNGEEQVNSSNAHLDQTMLFYAGNFLTAGVANGQNVRVTATDHAMTANDTVYIEFLSGDQANLSNGIYTVGQVANTNVFYVVHPYAGSANAGTLSFGRVI